MKIKEFFEKLDELYEDSKKDNESFKKNIGYDDLSFCEWIEMWLTWNEWIDVEDCKNYYE